MNVSTQTVQVLGSSGCLLDNVHIFKGKMLAAAARNKFTDAVDLLFLEGKYRDMLRSDVNALNLRDVGMALRRYSHLNAAFQRIGVDIQAALQAANASIKLSENRAPFDIQQGVLG